MVCSSPRQASGDQRKQGDSNRGRLGGNGPQLLFLRLQGRRADSLNGQSAGADEKTKSQQTESLVGCKRHTCFSCGKSGAKQTAREQGLLLGWQGNSQSSAGRENGSQ